VPVPDDDDGEDVEVAEVDRAAVPVPVLDAPPPPTDVPPTTPAALVVAALSVVVATTDPPPPSFSSPAVIVTGKNVMSACANVSVVAPGKFAALPP